MLFLTKLKIIFQKNKSIRTFRYKGKAYYTDDLGNVGSYRDCKYSIFKWNEEKKRYDLLAEM